MDPSFKKSKGKITVPGHMMAPAKRFGAQSVTQKTMAFFKVTFWGGKVPKKQCQYFFSCF